MAAFCLAQAVGPPAGVFGKKRDVKIYEIYARFLGHAGVFRADKQHARDRGDGDARDHGRDDGGVLLRPLDDRCLCRTCRNRCNPPRLIQVRMRLGLPHGGGGFLARRRLHARIQALGCGICTRHMWAGACRKTQGGFRGFRLGL